jgi:peptidoglycan-associated lipoprotein
MPHFKLIAITLVAVVLAACASTPIPDPEPMETTGANSGASTDGYEDGFGGGEEIEYDPTGGELSSIIYFDFDSSEVRPVDTDIVARHAALLANDSRMRVRLEGHADERGSREYNIGLGERRSQAVRRLLLIQGASSTQISTVSFGEERPAESGSDELAYARNRRVEFKYTN